VCSCFLSFGIKHAGLPRKPTTFREGLCIHGSTIVAGISLFGREVARQLHTCHEISGPKLRKITFITKQSFGQYPRIICTIGVGASKFLDCAVFLSEFPQTCPKVLCNFCLQIFSHKDHEDLFLVWPLRNSVFICFSEKPWASFFEVTQRWAPYLPRFSRILPRFFDNSNWGCACTPASYTDMNR